MTVSREDAETFLALFQGNMDAHGTHGVETLDPETGKYEIKHGKGAYVRTLREPVTVELWLGHLKGEKPIGIIPINDEGLCSWGVIDIDIYDVQHKDLAARFVEAGLPLILCRSKSGGAHCFVFLSEPMPAADLISKLTEIKAFLGFAGSEIFPKQVELLSKSGDTGNWLNMPYFGGDETKRYAIDEKGRPLSMYRFLEAAEKNRVAPAAFMEVNLTKSEKTSGKVSSDPDLKEGPPCLQHLAQTGVPAGNRNNALFNYGILAKKQSPDDWQAILENYNRKFIEPPLGTEEVTSVIKSLKKKDYNYRCKDAPIVDFCNSGLCRKRKFGVGGDGGPSPGITSISVLNTAPPLFFVTLTGGGTVECNSDQLLTPKSFQVKALEQQRVVLPMYKPGDWVAHINTCMASATVIDAPPEVGVEGHFQELLQKFCTDKHAAKARDEMLLGKAWLNEEDDAHGMKLNHYYFRLSDLMAFLETQRFRDMTRAQIHARIREMEGGQKFMVLRSRGTNTWFVPNTFDVQTEPFDTPAREASPI